MSSSSLSTRRRLPAELAFPGDEDQYTFVVGEGGGIVVETTGFTDLRGVLFGPDDLAIRVAEDAGGGLGGNVRIATGLSLGRYLVRIRHQRATGVGSYRIGVRRA